MNEQKLLERAAEIISGQDRLGKHTFRDADGMLCMLGAILEAVREYLAYPVQTYITAREQAQATLDEHGYLGLAEFNDKPGTTKEDVVLILKKAAEAAEPSDG